jgi:hypothetical protein
MLGKIKGSAIKKMPFLTYFLRNKPKTASITKAKA